ncbi:1-deoxy-D-xylulose-5-phosphate reductoisomerase [Pseudopelagicola sp. nBUS_20]|uniref:1-deoxy-D-xylulose-5-phosphate reductoisomerase n=1 Tax=Pseudopelagicola sp. nBUS_20 TaxID=3395317 RepID=UPI003EB79A9B
MKKVSILGSTGSIGQSTVELIARDLQSYEVIALTGGQNIASLARDALRLRAKIAVTADCSRLGDLQDLLAGSEVEAAAGSDAVIEAAGRPADWVMSSIIGAAGLAPGIRALQQGATLALANKESLVTAGQLIMKTARDYGGCILPVDSEHSAIFQGLVGEDMNAVERIIITASGGAFRDWSLEDMAKATPEQASCHPNWKMGQKITIDSASMFNKALEVIETKEFFGCSSELIEVLIHPESIVHALVGFNDGALMAHVGPPDMRHAIGYALHWPARKNLPVQRLDLAAIGSLHFQAPDPGRYPALRLAHEVLKIGGHAGAVFNAAKEVALDGFIEHRIGFLQMAEVVEEVMDRLVSSQCVKNTEMSLDTVKETDHLARLEAGQVISDFGT